MLVAKDSVRIVGIAQIQCPTSISALVSKARLPVQRVEESARLYTLLFEVRDQAMGVFAKQNRAEGYKVRATFDCQEMHVRDGA